ncbi:MAG TPA: GTPase domain-containing protein [Acidobacteriota bacterium]|jgi:signal recognition particle receptor subunit beta|nr:GTPase domain-containing protein [Acidobacteriota bacterium]
MTMKINIVLFGPPLAGKRTIAEAFAKQNHAKIEMVRMKCADNESVADAAIYVTTKLSHHASIILTTLSGAVWSMSSWDQLFQDIDGVVLVLDPQETRQNADDEAKTYLEEKVKHLQHPHIGCIVATKSDLIKNGIRCMTKKILEKRYSIRQWPFYYSDCEDELHLIQPVQDLAREVEKAKSVS